MGGIALEGRTTAWVCGVALVGWFGLGCSAGEARTAQEQIDRGAHLYRVYCRTCHGPTGRGDGRTSHELLVAPADLTLISSRNGGEFPGEQVFQRIDGRSEVPAHGPTDMPVWGLAFRETGADENQEAAVEQRIGALVAYLESIQTEDAP